MRIVVKIGSSSLVTAEGRRDEQAIGRLSHDIARTIAHGHQLVLVSSGAIATGLGVLGRAERPVELPALQAASAVGQGALFSSWSSAFAAHGLVAGQVLLTMHDAGHRTAWVNARNTLEQLLAWNVLPVVNENDTTATDEITFGDNDLLAAQVAVSVKADLLVLLTDIDGLYTEHPDSPDAQLIEEVNDHSLLRRIDTAQPGSHWGSGGMRSKVVAAEMASTGGIITAITSARHDDVVTRLAAGERIGTRIAAGERRGSSFKLWLRHAKPPRGTVQVDAGARAAIVEQGASLLAVGVRAVEGSFQPGDAVTVADDSGRTFAKGICEYSSADLERALGSGSALRGAREVIHRDQLVLLDESPQPAPARAATSQ